MGPMTDLPRWPADISRSPGGGAFESGAHPGLPPVGTATSFGTRSREDLAKPGWRDVVPVGALLVLCVGLHVAAMFPRTRGARQLQLFRCRTRSRSTSRWKWAGLWRQRWCCPAPRSVEVWRLAPVLGLSNSAF